MSHEIEFVKLFTGSGPWAVAFGYAFQLIVRAWQQDRERLDRLLTEIQKSLAAQVAGQEKLALAIEGLSDRLDDIERTHARITPRGDPAP